MNRNEKSKEQAVQTLSAPTQDPGDVSDQLTFFVAVAASDAQSPPDPASEAFMTVHDDMRAETPIVTSPFAAMPTIESKSTVADDQVTPAEGQSSMPEAASSETAAVAIALPESLGQRLAAARESRGWSCDEAASRLHLPSQIVKSIEADQFERIGYGVYLRGYLTSYARLVNVPASAVEDVFNARVTTPELIASGRISHSRFLFERYSGSAVYLVLTGFIVVPLVMSAMNLGGDVSSRLTPLDVSSQSLALPDAAQSDLSKTAVTGENSASATSDAAINANTSASGSVAPPAASSERPLMASFAMFPNQQASAAQQLSSGAAGQLRLSLTEPSWVEIIDADGKRLEYSTLPAGTVKSYVSERPLDVRLGNTIGAKLEVGGQIEDIAPYNRGNVAHFKLFAAGKPISKID